MNYTIDVNRYNLDLSGITSFVFEIKTCSRAHVLLSSSGVRNSSEPLYEIIFYKFEFEDYRLYICYRTKSQNCNYETFHHQIEMNCTMYLPFWIIGCIYKGQFYKAGDEWDDGCDLLCPEFTRLPALCELTPVSGQCCKRLQCRTPTTVAPGVVTPTPFIPTPDPHPGCTDAIENCADYGQSVCQPPYDAWGRRNCQHNCGMCAQPGMNTPTPSCQDKLPKCDLYGKKVCVNEYVPWAKENCQHYCGMCVKDVVRFTNATTIHNRNTNNMMYVNQMTTSTPSCVDKNPSACAEIGPDVCTLLIDFAKENCARQCKFCHEPAISSVQVTSMLSLQCVTYVLNLQSSVQVTSMLSLQCVTYVLFIPSVQTFSIISTSKKYVIITMLTCPQTFSTISTSNKYVIQIMCNLSKPSVSSVQVTKYVIITMCNLCPKPSVTLQCVTCPKPSVSSVQVTSMLSLQMCNLCPKPSTISQ
ncbi:unnamed protein product [Mytilus edulis]|uniref:ShKT domain-containing protein n=1 Tax=Mytilus edulis TaxID=6550 RepID=A0A8S3RFS5_MYTED|nr:unnamed protein product [Mytilus edulis]